MTHLLAFSTMKSHSLNFGVKCVIHTNRFLCWQHIYTRVVFFSSSAYENERNRMNVEDDIRLAVSRRRHKTEFNCC